MSRTHLTEASNGRFGQTSRHSRRIYIRQLTALYTAPLRTFGEITTVHVRLSAEVSIDLSAEVGADIFARTGWIIAQISADLGDDPSADAAAAITQT